MLNGPNGRTVNLVTEQKYGDIELYLEFMIAKGSNSGVYLHGLYEVQTFDSWDSTEAIGKAFRRKKLYPLMALRRLCSRVGRPASASRSTTVEL